MNWKTKIVIAIGLGACFYSCKPDDDLSDIPTLESRSFNVFRNQQLVADSAVWTLGFTDGDGDFGIRANTPDTAFDNLISSTYTIKNGIETVLEDETVRYKIPSIAGVNTERGLQGKLEISIQLNIYAGRDFDTMRIEGYLLDRAQNRSNTVSSPLIVLN